MTNKRLLLVKIKKYFFDPHGSPDFGGKRIIVVEDNGPNLKSDKWCVKYHLMIDENLTYSEDGIEVDVDTDELYAEDGYNCVKEYYSIKVISESEYLNYGEIIQKYKNL